MGTALRLVVTTPDIDGTLVQQDIAQLLVAWQKINPNNTMIIELLEQEATAPLTPVV